MAPPQEASIEQLAVVDSYDDGKVIHSKKVDEALHFLDDSHVAEGEFSDINDKKLMRKIDWMLMPLMFACYFLQYSDKTLRKYWNRYRQCGIEKANGMYSKLCIDHGCD
jgi:hypothetical protein